MRQSLLLSASSVILSAALLYAPLAQADDTVTGNAYTIAQGVAGAPRSGMTGTGGGAGVNDHDAGTDINDSYNNPSHNNASGNSTKVHHRRSRNSENNDMNPPGTYGGANNMDSTTPSGNSGAAHSSGSMR